MKAIIFVLVLAFVALAQQVNYTYGLKTVSGDAWDGDGISFIDTTTGTTNLIIVDLNDFYFVDPDPYIVGDTSGTEKGNSSRLNIGTFYTYWDNQGTASPTTDSLLYTMKVYPGVYTTDSRAVAGLKWGTAVLVDSVVGINDTFTQSNVYLHSTLGKSFPAEVIKIELAPVGRKGCDDSTKVNWRFAYPAIHQVYKEKK